MRGFHPTMLAVLGWMTFADSDLLTDLPARRRGSFSEDPESGHGELSLARVLAFSSSGIRLRCVIGNPQST